MDADGDSCLTSKDCDDEFYPKCCPSTERCCSVKLFNSQQGDADNKKRLIHIIPYLAVGITVFFFIGCVVFAMACCFRKRQERRRSEQEIAGHQPVTLIAPTEASQYATEIDGADSEHYTAQENDDTTANIEPTPACERANTSIGAGASSSGGATDQQDGAPPTHTESGYYPVQKEYFGTGAYQQYQATREDSPPSPK